MHKYNTVKSISLPLMIIFLCFSCKQEEVREPKKRLYIDSVLTEQIGHDYNELIRAEIVQTSTQLFFDSIFLKPKEFDFDSITLGSQQSFGTWLINNKRSKISLAKILAPDELSIPDLALGDLESGDSTYIEFNLDTRSVSNSIFLNPVLIFDYPKFRYKIPIKASVYPK